MPVTVSDVNTLDQEQFVALLDPLFEQSPWIAAATWQARPFMGLPQLHDALCAVMYGAPVEQQVALIRAHPDLVGRAARAGTLTPDSQSEQASAGLDRLSPEEVATFTEMNDAYRDRFGFPFVICVRENKKAGILAGFHERLSHMRDEEIATALGEIAKIGHLRLLDRVREGEERTMQTGLDYSISYGKAAISVYRTYARPLIGVPEIPESPFTGRDNNLFACEITVEVFGDDFLPAYTKGDNRNVVATDTMKNVVLQRALAYEGATLEGFLLFLGEQFLANYPGMERLRLTGIEQPFDAVRVPNEDDGVFGASGTLFSRSHNSAARATLTLARDGADSVITVHECGCTGLELIKLTGSSFARFARDAYTTLPEMVDRPLFIHCDIAWTYTDVAEMLAPDLACYIPAEQVRDCTQVVFHQFVSKSIQHLVHEIGVRLLDRFPQMASVSFAAQNRLWDTSFTAEDDPKRKVYTDPRPPYGTIRLTLSRQ